MKTVIICLIELQFLLLILWIFFYIRNSKKEENKEIVSYKLFMIALIIFIICNIKYFLQDKLPIDERTVLKTIPFLITIKIYFSVLTDIVKAKDFKKIYKFFAISILTLFFIMLEIIFFMCLF